MIPLHRTGAFRAMAVEVRGVAGHVMEVATHEGAYRSVHAAATRWSRIKMTLESFDGHSSLVAKKGRGKAADVTT